MWIRNSVLFQVILYPYDTRITFFCALILNWNQLLIFETIWCLRNSIINTRWLESWISFFSEIILDWSGSRQKILIIFVLNLITKHLVTLRQISLGLNSHFVIRNTHGCKIVDLKFPSGVHAGWLLLVGVRGFCHSWFSLSESIS